MKGTYDPKAMSLADFEVTKVMARRDLERPGPELSRHIRVCNDRDLAADQGENHLLADGLCVPWIFGVHGNRRICQHRLGARRGHHDPLCWLGRANGYRMYHRRASVSSWTTSMSAKAVSHRGHQFTSRSAR